MANKCIFIARIVQDPILTETSNGTQICRFTLAVKRDYTTKNEADFVNFTAFKSNAKYIGSYGKQGMLVYVESKFQTFTKNGNEPAQKPENGYNFVVDKFEILSTKEEMKRYNNREEVESVPTQRNNGTKQKLREVLDNDAEDGNLFDNIPF